MSATAAIRIGTRGSLLARSQAGQMADVLLGAHPGLRAELKIISTTGDRIIDRPLADAGGKGLFTKELELALLANEIDLAVHSLKDVPVTMPLVDQTELTIAGIPARADPRDVLVSHKWKTLHDLPPGATVGTGSLRRRCQILTARPDLIVEPLRGNIDTRLKKLEAGQCAAIVLALAGLHRIGKFDAGFMTPIDPAIMLPAAGQGALALQCRRSDAQTIAIAAALNDSNTCHAVTAERAVVAALNGDCDSAIGCLAILEGMNLTLSAAQGSDGGEAPVARASSTVARDQWKNAVESVSRALLSCPA